MSVRYLMMVCVLAFTLLLPLAGCKGETAGGSAGNGGSGSSNTTNAE